MVEFFRRLFTSDFMPHGTCYFWNSAVLWLNVISDGVIALAYYTIPILLFSFARKRKDLTFHRIFLAFGVFILACGTTHVMGIWTVWHGTYRLAGLVKAITGAASVATALMMIPLLPALVRLPGPSQLSRLKELLSEEVSERDEASRVLLEQAGLLDLAHDAIIVRRTDGTVLFWNRGAETMYGWPKNEALGRKTQELIKTRAPVPIDEIIRLLSEQGRWEGELIHTKRDGGTVIVASRWASRRTHDGQLEILEINTDITRQKAAEERLRTLNQELEQRVIERTTELRLSNEQLHRSTERYQFLADSVPQMVWTTRPDGTPEYFNRRWQEYCGRNQRQNPNWYENVYPDDLPAVVEKWQAARESGQRYDVECRIQSVAGSCRWHLVRALPMLSEEGSIIQWVGTCTDINDQKSFAEVLERRNQELHEEMARRQAAEQQLVQSQKMEAIGQLAGGVAHDFNNLLTIIVGHGRLLQSELPAESALQERLAAQLTAAERAAGLINQLLAFSRRQIVQPRPVNLNKVVENAGKMLRRLISEDIRLNIALSPDLSNTKIDPGQVEQILLNLVINAKDAMPQGGQITVETSNLELAAGTADKLSLTPGKYVMLAVSDTGTGIDPAIQSRIFEPFFTTKDVGKGTGLGLSTVYGIVKQSGGDVTVQSQPGAGTTFRVYLPQFFEPVEPSTAESPSARMPRGTETIILVEDEAGLRKLARDVLVRQGYAVRDFAGGAAALTYVSNHEGAIHMLLTDVVMPGMTGGELAQRLERLYPQIKVLFMTGYTEDTVVHHGVVDTGVRLLQKPFSPQSLALKVREVLDAKKREWVLVVENEEPVRALVRQVLERNGYQVTEAGDMREALAQSEKNAIDLVVTDLVMSDEKAMTAAQAMHSRLPKLKMIIISGAARAEVLAAAEKLGVQATLQKPIQPQELLDTVERLLG